MTTPTTKPTAAETLIVTVYFYCEIEEARQQRTGTFTTDASPFASFQRGTLTFGGKSFPVTRIPYTGGFIPNGRWRRDYPCLEIWA